MNSDMEVTITSLAEGMDLHVNQFTAAVNSLLSATSNSLGNGQDQCIRENPEQSDNSETEEVGHEGSCHIHEDDRTLYQEKKNRNYCKGFP